MDRYFVLNCYCVYVEGKNGYVIYNLKNKKIFSLDKENSSIFRLISKNTDIDGINKIHGEKCVKKLIKNLIKEEMGEYSQKVYIQEKYRVGQEQVLEIDSPPNLNTCYIELPIDCEKKCNTCFNIKHNGCTTCSIPNIICENIDLDFYKKILLQVINLGYKRIVLFGGNVFSKWNEVIDIIKFCKSKSNDKMNIIINSNADLITKSIINDLIKYKVSPLVVFNCVEDNDIIYKINNINNLFRDLCDNNIEYYANLVVDNSNELYKKQECILNAIKRGNFRKVSVSTVIYNENKTVQSIRKTFNNSFINSLGKSKEFHPCLNGSMCIKADKTVLPCPLMKTHILADLRNSDIVDMFEKSNSIYKYWKISLDKVNNCKECKYRLSCNDCRAIEELLTSDLYGKKLCEEIC